MGVLGCKAQVGGFLHGPGPAAFRLTGLLAPGCALHMGVGERVGVRVGVEVGESDRENPKP